VPQETPGQKKENRIMYQNRATLIGFLGKDAEVKTTRNNASFTVLSLATKRTWKDRESGDYMSETTWHRCIVWGKLGEFAATLTKGAHVQIEGDIRTREYTPKTSGKKSDSVTKTITEIRVFTINKLDRPAKAGDGSEVEVAAA
jgi:single-strand DNA-binding protein